MMRIELKPLQNDCTHFTQLFFCRRNVPSPKRPVAELAVAETSRRRTGDRRNVPSPKRWSPNWRRRMGVAETASPKRPIPYSDLVPRLSVRLVKIYFIFIFIRSLKNALNCGYHGLIKLKETINLK